MANYPTSASTDANLYVAVNSLATAIVGALTSVGGNNGANIEVVSTTGFPSTGFITIDTEAISYTSILSGPPRFAGITRGADGTTASAHNAGTAAKHNIIAAHHNAPKDEIIALETHLIPGQHTGTATNDNAAAGKVGEAVRSNISTLTNFPTTNTLGDLTSISLTAGDWDVDVVLQAFLNGATMSSFYAGVSTTSGNSGTGLVDGDNRIQQSPPSDVTDTSVVIPSYRFSLSATTTIYLKYLAQYTAGTPQARGRISARRVR